MCLIIGDVFQFIGHCLIPLDHWSMPKKLTKIIIFIFSGYVRMESMEKPVQQQLNASQENTSPSNFDKPYTSIQLSNFGGPYSKMTGSGETGREVKAEPSSTHPGYIEVIFLNFFTNEITFVVC